jgi:anti-sigma regulatory factor (Ser/Thr protein kinase)
VGARAARRSSWVSAEERDTRAEAADRQAEDRDAAARARDDAVGDDPRLLVLERHALYRTHTPTAITSFRQLAAEHATPGRRVRVVGEVDFGTTLADQREWQRYEAVINSAFAAAPLWGLCVFDTTMAPAPILATARHTHPQLRTATGRQINPGYVDPATYLRALPVPVEPLEATVEGPADVIEDYLLAVDEMTSHAVRHGRRPVGLRLWTAPGRLVCRISDAGAGWDDPSAGYGPAHGEDLSHGGMGLWLARQLCDHVAIRREPLGSACASPSTAPEPSRRPGELRAQSCEPASFTAWVPATGRSAWACPSAPTPANCWSASPSTRRSCPSDELLTARAKEVGELRRLR